MAEANQFLWTHRELVALMVKDAGIHEGKWQLVITYGMSPMNFGPAPDQASPGMIVAVTNVGIQRMLSDQPLPPPSLFVDAAEVNPPSNKTPASKPSKG